MKNKQIPAHIGIILDGNGRWAKKRGLPRMVGHQAGVEAVKRVIQNASELGIKALSVFAFSTENWKRPKEEVDGIFQILDNYLSENGEKFIKDGYKLQTMGDVSKLNNTLREKITELIEKTKNNSGLIFNIGLNYGGRAEIIRAVNAILKENKKDITEKEFEDYLYTNNLPPLDFVIRTSGEQRISNFMLWQMAYSELYFTKTYWPSFGKKHLTRAIKIFQKRNRRFGKV